MRLIALGAYASGQAPAYVPAAPVVHDRGLQVLPNLDVVAVADLDPGDRLVLDAFAVRTADRVWTVSMASLLSAVDAGRAPGEFTDFLAARAVHGLPAALGTLGTTSTRARGRSATSDGDTFSSAPTSRLLERDRSLRGLCTRIGERHLLLDPAGEEKARTALRKLGYPLGPATS